MSEKPLISPLLMQCGMLLVAVSVAWGLSQSDLQAQAVRLADHEQRLRNMESQLLTGLMDLKGEFGIIKTRLTAIERAVKL